MGQDPTRGSAQEVFENPRGWSRVESGPEVVQTTQVDSEHHGSGQVTMTRTDPQSLI